MNETKTQKEKLADLLSEETIRVLRDRTDLRKELNQAGVDPSKIKDAVIKEIL